MEKMAWDGPKWGREDLFPSNPDLASILDRMDLNFDILFFVWTPMFWISRSPDLQISRFPDCQTPPALDPFSDPNLTPLPTHPVIKYARSPSAAKRSKNIRWY